MLMVPTVQMGDVKPLHREDGYRSFIHMISQAPRYSVLMDVLCVLNSTRFGIICRQYRCKDCVSADDMSGLRMSDGYARD